MNKDRHHSNNDAKLINGVIEVKLTEVQTPEALIALKQQIIAWSKDGQRDAIINVSPAKMGSPETRAEAERFFSGLPYRRFAIWGGSPPVNLGIKSLLEMHSDGDHVKIFLHEDDARAWLDEDYPGTN